MGSRDGSAAVSASPPSADRGGPVERAVRVPLAVYGIRKSFFGVAANYDVSLTVESGAVHALLGENGAGKSTICSIMAGLYQPDEGELHVDGRPRRFASPRDALDHGVGMVFQHFHLVRTFTVAENIVLGHPDTPKWLSTRDLHRRVVELGDRYGMTVRPDALISELSVGEQQRVEILKLLHREVRVLILDEPTAVLTPQEVETLFGTVRRMCEEGRAVILISHKLREVIEVSDRITVLRDGRVVGDMVRPDFEPRALAAMMIGRELTVSSRHRVAVSVGAPRLEVRDLTVESAAGRPAVERLSLSVRGGEILGVAGVSGNGQRELADVVVGLRQPVIGEILLDGSDVSKASVRDRIEDGLGFVPEDRLQDGVAAKLSLDDNLMLKCYWQSMFRRGPFLARRAIERRTNDLVALFDIRGSRRGLPVSLLSGGNVQKAVLARELTRNPGALVTASPTRGLDVGAATFVHDALLAARERGAAILLISEDLEEIRLLADRIVVMYEGRIMGELRADDFDEAKLGLMMAGEELVR